MKDWKRLPFICVGLAICNVIIYLCCLFGIGDFYIAGGLDAPAVIGEGEYYRIISSLFLHGNSTHLFNNMMILLFLGAMLEKELGHVRFLVLYFLSGIGGNLLSLYVKVREAEAAVSIGASGAVFGLDGVLVAMVLFWGKKPNDMTPQRVILVVLLSLYSGFTSTNVDNAAHIGGLITGFTAGCIVCAIRHVGKKNSHIGDESAFGR
ncbi:MAG: rhomboid family intramembrane serine protease [Acetatifactor sp.]